MILFFEKKKKRGKKRAIVYVVKKYTLFLFNSFFTCFIKRIIYSSLSIFFLSFFFSFRQASMDRCEYQIRVYSASLKLKMPCALCLCCIKHIQFIFNQSIFTLFVYKHVSHKCFICFFLFFFSILLFTLKEIKLRFMHSQKKNILDLFLIYRNPDRSDWIFLGYIFSGKEWASKVGLSFYYLKRIDKRNFYSTYPAWLPKSILFFSKCLWTQLRKVHFV